MGLFPCTTLGEVTEGTVTPGPLAPIPSPTWWLRETVRDSLCLPPHPHSLLNLVWAGRGRDPIWFLNPHILGTRDKQMTLQGDHGNTQSTVVGHNKPSGSQKIPARAFLPWRTS
jgi:hypothetical protein